MKKPGLKFTTTTMAFLMGAIGLTLGTQTSIEARDAKAARRALACIQRTQMPRIRQGTKHRFINMWIVPMNKRLFARSYTGGRGWYTAFLKNKRGAILCGGVVYKVHGVIPRDKKAIGRKLNAAYLKKYNNDSTERYYAKRLNTTGAMSRTLEFIVVGKR